MTNDRLLFMAHCILNPHSAIHGGTQHRDLANRLVSGAMERGVGIIQLPCPETTLLGARRWAQSYEQYDTPWFHDHCDALLRLPIRQLIDHLADGKRLVAVVGIAGSPSCSTFEVTSAAYGGLVPGMTGAPVLAPSSRVPCQGHFMRILQKNLQLHSIPAELLELPRVTCTDAEAATFLSRVSTLLDG